MDKQFLANTIIAILITIVSYLIGVYIYKKTKNPLLNPIITSLLVITLVVLATPFNWEQYIDGTKVVVALLPLTIIILAIPLHRQWKLLKENYKAVLAGTIAGVITSAISLVVLGKLFGLHEEVLRSILPKSITTPLGLSLCDSLGGLTGVTVISIVITGVLGVVLYLPVFKLFRIKHPIARGVALGTASHAVGTSKAIELGDIEGAMSSVSIIVTGVVTVLATPLLIWILSIY